MFANCLKLLGLSLLIAIAAYSIPAYHPAQANSSDTSTLTGSRGCSPLDINNLKAVTTILEHLALLTESDVEFFTKASAPNREAMRKYSQLSELSNAYRRASFSLMTAEDKSSVWRVHLSLNLARHPEWTEKQRSVVLEAIAVATPALYEFPKDSNWNRRVNEPVRSLTERAQLVFSKQEAAALFSELGLNEQIKSNHARPSAGGSCGCSTESDWCSHQCVATSCTVLTWGCGTFGLYACNGDCYAPPKESTPTPTPTPTPRPKATDAIQ
ncbi:MAG TPA: bacteriocin fulvocin C-related protein [Pyrinomonadaceae bacterium]|nr:bacteriocin fulvocin C-related protein [Pyrinomonadaceae bacterium]